MKINFVWRSRENALFQQSCEVFNAEHFRDEAYKFMLGLEKQKALGKLKLVKKNMGVAYWCPYGKLDWCRIESLSNDSLEEGESYILSPNMEF